MSKISYTEWRLLLTSSERAMMLDDIARVSLAVGQMLYPEMPWQDMNISACSFVGLKSPMERLGHIEHSINTITSSINQLVRSPIIRLVSRSRPITPVVRARRVSAQAIISAARHGLSARYVDETIPIKTWDSRENRAVKSFVHFLQKESAAVAAAAEAQSEPEAAQRAGRCERLLCGLTSAPWWEEVTREEEAWRIKPSQGGASRPEYAKIYREMARYRSELRFDWQQPLFTLPPQDTWRLYEIWCFFKVLEALRSLGYEAANAIDIFTFNQGRLIVTLAHGSPSRIALSKGKEKRVSLLYNQTYRQGDQSLSHTMQPDIILAAEDDSQSLWILDAKFKSYSLPGEETDDINQMHAYRDAIVGHQSRRVVVHAWCLFAGLSNESNRERITYSDALMATKGSVGALCLRPGSDTTLRNLAALLTTWLADRTTRPVLL